MNPTLLAHLRDWYGEPPPCPDCGAPTEWAYTVGGPEDESAYAWVCDGDGTHEWRVIPCRVRDFADPATQTTLEGLIDETNS